MYIFFSTDRPGGPGGHNRNYGNNAPDNNLGLAAQLLAKPEALTTALTTLASLSSLGNLGGGLLAGLAGSGSGTGGSGHVTGRALLDITSGPEVRQNLKIRTDQKPDVFLPGRWTFKQEYFHGYSVIYTRCGHVVRDFESEAKTRCNFQFR